MRAQQYVRVVSLILVLVLFTSLAFCTESGDQGTGTSEQQDAGADNGPVTVPVTGGVPLPPPEPVRLIFIHHSCGENWLSDWNGGLGIALRDNNYAVSDTNYGWGPDAIGDRTDIPNQIVFQALRGPLGGSSPTNRRHPPDEEGNM
jgi:hypothetical protein